MWSFIKRIFIWWDGATIGTWLATLLFGAKVGTDAEGNRYYSARGGRKRWVIYNGEVEASRVPAEWHRWLHHTTDVPPSLEPVKHKPWERPHQPNPTGTASAYRPKGSLYRPSPREPATGDYQPWRPNRK